MVNGDSKTTTHRAHFPTDDDAPSAPLNRTRADVAHKSCCAAGWTRRAVGQHWAFGAPFRRRPATSAQLSVPCSFRGENWA